MFKIRSETLLIQSFYIIISFSFLIYLIGFKSLNPFNLDWLLTNDQVSELIGWLDYKNSNFSFPLGNFEKPGLGQSSIIYHGTVPLFALFFKIFFSYLDNFQYFSFWIFICIYLQGFLSFLILKKFTDKNLTCLIGSIFFIISPILIFRIGVHLSLSAHWLILLYYLNHLNNGKNYHLNNILIIAIASGIHFYFAAILLLINTIYYFLYFKKSFFIKYILINLSFLSLVMFSLGYFVLPPQDVIGYGYGFYKMNLLSIIDPTIYYMGNEINWSYFLPDIYNYSGEQEGFNYLGLGTILIFLLSLSIFLKGKFKIKNKDNLIIFFIGIVLFSLAISNNINFGKYNVISFELNKFVLGSLGMIRASGRLFWPIYYLIIIFSLIIVIKKFKIRSPIIITFFLMIQIIDLSPGFKFFEFGKNFIKDRKILKDEIWSKIDDEFEVISHTFVKNQSNDFFNITHFLVNSDIKSEIFYSARYNRKKMTDLRYRNYQTLYRGDLGDKIFVVSSKSHLNHLKNLYSDNKEIKFVNRDDIWMVFKSNRIDNNNFEVNKLNQIQSKKIPLNKKIDVKLSNNLKEISYLGLGWEKYNQDSQPWTDGPNSSLILKLPNLKSGEDYFIEIEFQKKPTIKEEMIRLEISSKGLDKDYKFDFKNTSKKIILKLRDINEDNRILILDLKLSGMISEFERLISPDERLIGLKLKSLKLSQ